MRGFTKLVAVALIGIAAIGCGGSGGQKVTINATAVSVRQSADATLSKGTAKIAFEMTLPIEGREVTAHGTGAIDPANKRFQLDIDLRDLATQMGSGDSLESLPSDALVFSEVVDGTALYMRNPATAIFGNGKPWLRMEFSQFGNVFDFENGGTFGADPSSLLHFLNGATSVTDMGSGDVRGVRTSHLSGNYTLERALAALPDDQRARVEQSFEGLGLDTSAEVKPIPFDVWIDNGLVRRLRSVFDPTALAPKAAPYTGTVTVTIEYYDFGQPVDISVPGPSEIADSGHLFPTSSSSSAN